MAPAGTIQPEPSGARPKRPRGFSRGPERGTSESEAGVAARIMRRDGRSSSAGFSENRSWKHISRDRRNNRQRVSVPQPEQRAETVRRERFHRSQAGRGQKGRAAFPADRSGQRRNRRQELRRVLCAATGVRPARGFYACWSICLSFRWQMNQSSAFNRCAGSDRGAARRTIVFISTERGAVPILPHPVIQPKSPFSFAYPKSLGSFFLWRGLILMSAEEGRCFFWWPLVRARIPRRSPGPKAQALSCLLSHSLDGNVERTAARCGTRIAGTN
jgi:hypothetical protein